VERRTLISGWRMNGGSAVGKARRRCQTHVQGPRASGWFTWPRWTRRSRTPLSTGYAPMKSTLLWTLGCSLGMVLAAAPSVGEDRTPQQRRKHCSDLGRSYLAQIREKNTCASDEDCRVYSSDAHLVSRSVPCPVVLNRRQSDEEVRRLEAELQACGAPAFHCASGRPVSVDGHCATVLPKLDGKSATRPKPGRSRKGTAVGADKPVDRGTKSGSASTTPPEAAPDAGARVVP
jgi:hypothetical protein